MGGGSQTSSSSMDPTYAVASTYSTLLNAAMSQDLWNMTKPYYQQQLQFSNDVMTPYYSDLYQNAQSLLPQQTALSGAQMDESLADIQRNAPVKDALAQEQLKELTESSPVREEFYKQALAGVDPDYERTMGKATADVEQSYAGAKDSIANKLAQMGLSANSGAYSTALANEEFNKARDKAFARSNAYMTEKNNTETENWNRLATAMNAAGRATGLSGYDSSQSNAASKNLAASSATNPYSSSNAAQGTSTALSGMSNAANTFANLGRANSTTTTSGGDSGWGTAIGTGVGLIGSKAIGKWG